MFIYNDDVIIHMEGRYKEDRFYLIGIKENKESVVLSVKQTIDDSLEDADERLSSNTSSIESFFIIKGIPIGISVVKTLKVD